MRQSPQEAVNSSAHWHRGAPHTQHRRRPYSASEALPRSYAAYAPTKHRHSPTDPLAPPPPPPPLRKSVSLGSLVHTGDGGRRPRSSLAATKAVGGVESRLRGMRCYQPPSSIVGVVAISGAALPPASKPSQQRPNQSTTTFREPAERQRSPQTVSSPLR